MRLIDVDKLKPDAEYNAWDGKFTAYSVKQIDEAPTVEVKASGDYIKREDAPSVTAEPQTYITEDRDTQILDAWQVHHRNTTTVKDELTTEQSSTVGERKPIMTEEVREAIMRLSMCARHECRMCQYRLTDDVDECRDRATKCMNTIVDAFTDCGADMRGSDNE